MYALLSRSSIAVFERYCQNQIFEGVHFEIQIGGPKRFPFKWKHWFLVSGMSALSTNIFERSPGRPLHSETNSASPGSILARQQLRTKAKSLTFPPLSIARYSFQG